MTDHFILVGNNGAWARPYNEITFEKGLLVIEVENRTENIYPIFYSSGYHVQDATKALTGLQLFFLVFFHVSMLNSREFIQGQWLSNVMSRTCYSFVLIRNKVWIRRCLCRCWIGMKAQLQRLIGDINTSGCTPCSGLAQMNQSRSMIVDSHWGANELTAVQLITRTWTKREWLVSWDFTPGNLIVRMQANVVINLVVFEESGFILNRHRYSCHRQYN